MQSEPIKRNRYSEPPLNEGDFSARNFDEDFNEFHLPLNRMQLANFQDWGIAQGLEVSSSIGDTTLTIAPGVASDIQGQLIALSTEEKGDIGSNPPSEEHQEVDVPVVLDLSRFAQTGETTYFLTIQFSQILRFDEGPLGRYEDAPWIRLQPVDDFVADGNSLVLARVTINSNGELTALQSQGRRLVSKTVQALSLRRPQLVDDRVQQVSAGKLASINNGLEISVPSTEDRILLSQEDGDNLAQLAVNADNSNFRGNINTTQNLQVEGAIAAKELNTRGRITAGQFQGVGIVPVGTIVAHYLDLDGADSLEIIRKAGFALCDGTTASQQGIENPVITSILPNLLDGRFLRGSAPGSTGVLQNEGTATNGLQVNTDVNEKPHSHHTPVADFANQYNSDSSRGWNPPVHVHWDRERSPRSGVYTTDSQSTNLSVRVSLSSSDNETRPTNMSVVWLIRVK